jgi:hypothetical protein
MGLPRPPPLFRGRVRRLNEDAQRQIDTRAIEIAGQALAQIEAHEKVCAVRQGQIITKLDGLEKTLARGVYGLVLILASIIGYFLVHGGIPQVHQ